MVGGCCDDSDKRDLRGTSLHEARFFVYATRDYFAGTCHVIPSPIPSVAGWGALNKARHSDEITQGMKTKKKVQLKLAIRHRPWENRHLAKTL
jgi:hypothetical protein